jgi:hypothetical protein
MTTSAALDVTCQDLLKENRRVYALKARRKKISLVCVEATNQDIEELRLLLGSSQLISAGKCYHAESPDVVFRKLSEFTWDFLLYTIIDFHPVSAAIEAFFFLTGSLYNWRLRRQLKLLSNVELLLKPGECKKALLGFRVGSQKLDELQVACCCPDGEQFQVRCAIV